MILKLIIYSFDNVCKFPDIINMPVLMSMNIYTNKCADTHTMVEFPSVISAAQ